MGKHIESECETKDKLWLICEYYRSQFVMSITTHKPKLHVSSTIYILSPA